MFLVSSRYASGSPLFCGLYPRTSSYLWIVHSLYVHRPASRIESSLDFCFAVLNSQACSDLYVSSTVYCLTSHVNACIALGLRIFLKSTAAEVP